LGKALPSSGTYQTELSKIEDEAFISIITGERPVSYFDTFVAQWKSQGGDVLTREANR
jgi:putative aldouronate transport system substrate-binding protein